MKKPLPKRKLTLAQLNDPRMLVGGLIIIFAAGVMLFQLLHKPAHESPAQVFAELQENKDVVQVSLFSIIGTKGNRLTGTGNVRYNKDGQIFRYGEGKFGGSVTLIFNDMASNGYHACAALISQAIPFKKEIFIAANGVAGSGGVPNPITGAVLSPGIVTLNTIKSCYYAAHTQ